MAVAGNFRGFGLHLAASLLLGLLYGLMPPMLGERLMGCQEDLR
jgi:hypothetical protein